MLTDDWRTLAQKAIDVHKSSLAKTLELFPFDEITLKKYHKLPSAIGSFVDDFGTPAPFPIDAYRDTLLAEDAEITEKDPYTTLQEIKSGKYTCQRVLEAYFHAAVIASKLVNCVYEFLPEESLLAAKKLDAMSAEMAAKKPLFGLPISIKEMVPYKNRAVTHGSLCYLDRVVDYDAVIVDICQKAGGIVFVRTTNPQSLMMLECESYTHGRTVNPFNSKLTCGGLSGGEGAVNGIGASPVGFGSDIGGSIRVPAAFNGIFGMRTTVGRLPTADYFSCQMGSEAILSVTGPLLRSLDLLELVMKTIIGAKPWTLDPSLAPIEWRSVDRKKYRIGILSHDGVVRPQPPVARALRLIKEKLLAAEHVEVSEYTPFEHAQAWKIITSLYFEDGGEDTRNTLKDTGEPMCELTEWALSSPNIKALLVHEIWKWNLEKQKYRKKHLEHWVQQGFDAVIAPVFPGPAAKHRTARYWGYTAHWNLVDYPVLVFPVTKVELQDEKEDYEPQNEMDRYVYEHYEGPEHFENAPVSLGAVGVRNSEEVLVAVVREVMKLIK